MPARRPVALALSLLVAVGLAGLVPSAAGAVVSAAPAVPTDCSRDVTAELQQWINATPDASTLAFTPGACYRVDGMLRIRRRTNLVLQGNGATLRQFTDGSELVNPQLVRTRSFFNFSTSNGITVRDLTLRGANPHAGRGDLAYQPRFEGQQGLNIGNVHGMVVDNIRVYDVFGDFVWVGPGTSDLTVRNSTFLRNGRQGWTINGTNILFEHNLIGETRRATIDMEPSLATWASRNVTIQDNEVGPGRLFFFASVGAGNAPIDGVNILRNRLHRGMQIYVASRGIARSRYRIVGNVSDTPVSGFGAAIVFRNATDVLVANNVVPLQPSHPLSGVGARRVQGLTITGNTFRGARSVLRDNGGNLAIHLSANRIGVPLWTPPPTDVPGPTPYPIR